MGKPCKIITPEYIQKKLSTNWTISDFCQDLMLTEKELMDFMSKHSNNKIYASFAQLVKQNEQYVKRIQRKETKKLKGKIMKTLPRMKLQQIF